jgi:hypothetical protein
MNISIIIPIHEYSNEISVMLGKAVETIETQEKIKELPEVYIVYASAIEKEIKNFIDDWGKSKLKKDQEVLKINLIKNDGASDFQSQINLAVKSVKTDYFSILEFDDEYSTTYFRNAEKYIKFYPKINFFLSLIIETNGEDKGIKTTNEMVWSQQFIGENGELGYLNASVLKQYTDFKMSGSVLNKADFIDIGGFKKNIKLTFMYEFLLRALVNTCKIYVIPKIGYKHIATREGSLFDIYQKKMPMNERKFWFDTATKESNFNNDRQIDISPLNVVDKK